MHLVSCRAILAKIFAGLFAISLLSACQSLNRAAKVGPAAPTAFLPHAAQLKAEPKRSPYQRNWNNLTPAAQAALRERTKIWIAPVDLSYLRPMSKAVSRLESSDRDQQSGARLLAEFMRAEFRRGFTRSPQPRYRLVDSPSKDALTLQLAIIELNPNSISAGLVRTAVNIAAVPGIDTLISRPLRANLAVEGVLRDSRSGLSLFEFADREESQSAFILAFRDLTTYGQARQAIRDWARQFEELTRTPQTYRVKESNAFTILPW